jgi:glycosyltransferase involved in cell wall biosynthesis
MRDFGTVAVIIPTYNRRDMVTMAVKSVLTQSYANLRCIVVDNGSTDGTAETLSSLGDSRLSIVSYDAPLGAAGARNAGVFAAEGAQWVAFLDNDDLWLPRKVERQLSALAANPTALWSATSGVHIGMDMRVRWSQRLRDKPESSPDGTLVSSKEVLGLLRGQNRIPAGGSSVLACLELVVGVGAFNVDVPGCEDWDLWIRLARNAALAHVDLPLVAYRIWEGQGSTDVPAMLRSAGRVRARYFPESGALPRSYVARWQRGTASRHAFEARRTSAAQDYLRAAWFGGDPRNVAYAMAVMLLPARVTRRGIDWKNARNIPDGWKALVEPWLLAEYN